MAIEIVSFPIEHGGSFHSSVKLPEGNDEIYLLIDQLMEIPCRIHGRYPEWLTNE